MPLVALWFAIFVVGATTFAVLHAKDEDANKAKEAKFEEAGESAEKQGGHVPPLEGESEAEGEAEAEGEGEAEGAEEAGPEEAPESAEEAEGGAAEGTEEGAKEAGGATEEGGGEEAGGDPEAGATVFAENCSVCHGEDGHGGAGGPDLRTMPKAKTEEGTIEQVTDGGGGMPPFGGQLSEEEIENVAAFVVQKVVGES
jgi:mono/diheme cytochrome c family protein